MRTFGKRPVLRVSKSTLLRTFTLKSSMGLHEHEASAVSHAVKSCALALYLKCTDSHSTIKDVKMLWQKKMTSACTMLTYSLLPLVV